MNRRTFIKVTGLAACSTYVPQSEAVLIEVACIIAGTIIISGGLWMGYKIYKTAKNKLYPPPPVPGNQQGTNSPPQLPPNTHSLAANARYMGCLEDEAVEIHNIDLSQMTDDDRQMNTLPDGSQATMYTTATLSGKPELEASSWTELGTIQIWLSATCYVIKYGDCCETGRVTLDPATMTLKVPAITVLTDTEAHFFKI